MKYTCCYFIILGSLQSFYSNFISFFGTNLLTQCPVPVAVFCLFFTSEEININRSPNTAKLFEDFFDQKTSYGLEKRLGGAPRGAQPTRARQEAQACPGGLCPPRVPPGPPLCSINTPKYQNPRGVDEIFIQPPQSPEPPDPI